MKFRYIILFVLISVTGILFFTNPDESIHKAFIKDKFVAITNQKIEEELEKTDDPNIKILGSLGKNFFPVIGAKFIVDLVNTRIRRVNYFLFSTTQVLYKDQWNTIGIGVFNKIYLFPKVEEELNKIEIKEEAYRLLNNN